MVQQYRKQLSNKPRLQSSLGGQKPVGNVKANQLIMAKVMKVNYLYNTVEVITIHNREMLVKQDDTRGQFSARMPVVFGGSYANGQSYGQTIPVNVGDQVLIGFMEEDKNAPVVIGVYKASSVAYELAPTNQVSGNPDTDTNTRKRVMEHLQLFPSQTYNWVDGEGGREVTFQGRSFLKSAVGLYGSSRLNDYGYNYENLERIHLRGRDIEPVEPELPQIMFQHNATFAPSATSVLFDDDGTFSLSKVNNNITNKNRSELRIEGSNGLFMRTQSDSKKHSDDSTYSELGIDGLTPYLQTPKHKLTIDDESGLLFDGQPIKADGDSKVIDELKKEVNKLENNLNDLAKVVGGEADGEIKDLLEDVKSLQDALNTLSNNFDDSRRILGEYDERLKKDERNIKLNSDALDSLTTLINNAAGSYKSLQDRLDTIEQKARSSEVVANEVIDARRDNVNSTTFKTIGDRLDSVSTSIGMINDIISDLGVIRENANKVPNIEDNLNRLSDTMNELTGGNGTVPNTTYESFPFTDYSLIKEGSSLRANLAVKVLRNGMDVTSDMTDNDIVWQRVSNDTAGDTVWNNAHRTPSKVLTLSVSDVNTSSRFKATLTSAHAGGYKQIIHEVSVYLEPLTKANVYITSNQGFFLTPNMTSTKLFATLYRDGKEIDTSGNIYTYTWYAYDNKGSRITGFKKTGKSIVVKSSDIKSGQSMTFKVDVSV